MTLTRAIDLVRLTNELFSSSLVAFILSSSSLSGLSELLILSCIGGHLHSKLY